MSEKLKATLENYLENLMDAQLNRALTIENHLKIYEDKLLKIRSVDEYIALSNHQRRLASLENGNGRSLPTRQQDETFISDAEQEAKERLKAIKGEQIH